MPTLEEQRALALDIQARHAAAGPVIAALVDSYAAGDNNAPILLGSITTSGVSSTGYTLAWPAATDDVAVLSYEVSIDGGVTWIGAGLSTSAVITGRTPGTIDAVRVVALDAAGNRSAALQLAVAVPADTVGPTMVGALTVSGITTTGYNVAWQPATDNIAVTGYEISLDSGVTYAPVAGLSYAASGRTPGATDNVRVRAKDAAGNAGLPLAAPVTLQALPPAGSAIVMIKVATTSTQSSMPPLATPLGQPAFMSLHGGGHSDLTQAERDGDEWRAICTGPQFAPAFIGTIPPDKVGYWCVVGRSGGKPYPSVSLIPYDTTFLSDGTKCRTQWTGFTPGLNQPMDLFMARRLRELLLQFPVMYPQIDPNVIWMTSNSMGSWGLAMLLQLVHDLIVGVGMTEPRWRREGGADAGNNGFEVMGLTSAPRNRIYQFGGGLQLSPTDGGGPADRYYDVIAYASNPANPMPFISWVIGKRDGYGPWRDQELMIQALRATKRPFAVSWNNGVHGQAPNAADIGTYDVRSFSRLHGMPLFTDSSRDNDPATDLVGGINLGFDFRNVVETPATWTCEVRNVLPGSTTVTVEPCLVKTFNPGKLPVAPITLTMASEAWTPVSFAV